MFLTNVLKDATVYTEHARRRTITADDVVRALKRNGRTLCTMQRSNSQPPSQIGLIVCPCCAQTALARRERQTRCTFMQRGRDKAWQQTFCKGFDECWRCRISELADNCGPCRGEVKGVGKALQSRKLAGCEVADRSVVELDTIRSSGAAMYAADHCM